MSYCCTVVVDRSWIVSICFGSSIVESSNDTDLKILLCNFYHASVSHSHSVWAYFDLIEIGRLIYVGSDLVQFVIFILGCDFLQRSLLVGRFDFLFGFGAQN